MKDYHIGFRMPYQLETLQRFIHEAQQQNINEIAIMEPSVKFFEFAPLYQEIRKTHPKQDEWYQKKATHSLHEYLSFVQQMKQQDFPITVKFGLCIDYLPQKEAFIKKMILESNLDLYTGRVYFIDNLTFSWNPDSFHMLWDKYHASYLVRKYYEQVHALITSKLFDGLADFELIHSLNVPYYFSLERTYQKTVKLLASHQMYVEADTSYIYRHKKSNMNLSTSFMELCKQMEVEYIFVSNALHPIEVGLYFDRYQED